MRVLFVHERCGPLAGAEANVQITATEFARRGHQAGILHGSPAAADNGPWSGLFCYGRSLHDGAPGAITAAALEEFQPDVIYVHKMADLDVIGALVKSGRPLVRMVHDHDIYCMRSYKYNYLTRKPCQRAASFHCVFPCGAFLVRNGAPGFPLKFVSYFKKRKEIALNRRFHRMIVVTNYMKDELLRNGFDSERIEIHAPAPRTADPGFRSTFSERNLILFAGQIIRGKGLDVLLDSLALMRTPFECVILGDGSQRARCEKRCARLKLQDRVQFMGLVPQAKLAEFYSECSVLAISSVWPEPYATIGVEALRYGIPVVAFDVGGIKDWLSDGYNGYLVPWMDRKMFAARLEQVLNDKASARLMGEQGRNRVNEMYNFSRYIEGLEAIFAGVIDEVGTKPARASQEHWQGRV